MPQERIGADFAQAFAALSQQIARVEVTAQATLVQATKTNGRVDALESLTKTHGVRLAALPDTSGDSTPLTRRDLWVATGTLAALGALINWWPNLAAAVRP